MPIIDRIAQMHDDLSSWRCRGERLYGVADRAGDRGGEPDQVSGQNYIENLAPALGQPMIANRPALKKRVDRPAHFILSDDIGTWRDNNVLGFHPRHEI